MAKKEIPIKTRIIKGAWYSRERQEGTQEATPVAITRFKNGKVTAKFQIVGYADELMTEGTDELNAWTLLNDGDDVPQVVIDDEDAEGNEAAAK